MFKNNNCHCHLHKPLSGWIFQFSPYCDFCHATTFLPWVASSRLCFQSFWLSVKIANLSPLFLKYSRFLMCLSMNTASASLMVLCSGLIALTSSAESFLHSLCLSGYPLLLQLHYYFCVKTLQPNRQKTFSEKNFIFVYLHVIVSLVTLCNSMVGMMTEVHSKIRTWNPTPQVH